jgi:hypothetical protein
LALAKANDIAARFPNAVVMGSDTVVDLDGEIIGKPDDVTHAEEIIRKLFSKPHKVITGLAMVCIEKTIEIVEADTTVVYPRRLTEAQIADHIINGQWQGRTHRRILYQCHGPADGTDRTSAWEAGHTTANVGSDLVYFILLPATSKTPTTVSVIATGIVACVSMSKKINAAREVNRCRRWIEFSSQSSRFRFHGKKCYDTRNQHHNAQADREKLKPFLFRRQR